MVVQDMMQREVITAPPSTSLAQAQHLMAQHHIRHLPVVADRRLLGMVTDRDLQDAVPSAATTLRPDDVAFQMKTLAIETCMTVPVVTAPPETDVLEAACQLLEEKFDCLPIVSQDRLVGIITTTDFLRAFLNESPPAGAPMLVTDYMYATPITIAPTDTVRTAYHRMRTEQVRHLPVVGAGQQLVGLLTDRDLRRLQGSDVLSLAVYEQREPSDHLIVQEAMVTQVVTVTGDTLVASVGELLLTHRFGCVPIVRDDGMLEGIVSVRDLVWAYVQQQGRGA